MSIEQGMQPLLIKSKKKQIAKVICFFLVETAEAEATLRKFGCYATLRILSPSRFARHGPGFDYRLTDCYRKNQRELLFSLVLWWRRR